MKTLRKEWRQQRLIFLIGCLAGIFLPVFQLIDDLRRRQQEISVDTGTGIVLAFGALVAILLAVATTFADTKKGIDEFWQSKPIRIWKVFMVKFLVAAAVILVCFLIITSLDFITNSVNGRFAGFAFSALCYTFPIALMLFCVTMFFTVILRDTAKAVLLSIWAALLFYFLPLLVNGLGWMNVFEQMEEYDSHSLVNQVLSIWLGNKGKISFHQAVTMTLSRFDYQYLWQYAGFLVMTFGIAIGCLILSIVAFERRLRWQPGQKTIAWAMGLSCAFIYGVSIFQVGQNLLPARTFEGKPLQPAVSFYTDPENTYDWLDKEKAGEMILQMSPYSRSSAKLLVNGDYLYKITIVSQGVPPADWQKPVRFDWFLDVFEHPAIERKVKHLAKVRFFSTPSAPANSAQPILNFFKRNGILYLGYVPYLKENNTVRGPLYFLAVDVSVPNKPVKIYDEIIEEGNFGMGTQGFAGSFGDYCYALVPYKVLVILVAEEHKPKVISRLDKDELGLSNNQQMPIANAEVIDDGMLLCYESSIVMILDVSAPEKPKTKFYGNLEFAIGPQEQIRCATYYKGRFYFGTKSGLYAYELKKGSDETYSMELVGSRSATPIERLAGRSAMELFAYNDILFEAANGIGILAYDIKDPSRPRRIYHGGDNMYVTTVGIWKGFLYGAELNSPARELLELFELPKAK